MMSQSKDIGHHLLGLEESTANCELHRYLLRICGSLALDI